MALIHNSSFLRYYAFVSIILFVGHLKLSSTIHSNDCIKTPASKHIMVVFIHGTRMPLPSLIAFGASSYRFLSRGRRLKKSWYQLYLDELRNKSTYQPHGPDGLHPFTQQASASIAANMFQKFFPTSCSFYTYSWDGRLSHRRRVKAAHNLYQQMHEHINSIKMLYSEIEIIVICHSHGGNVALNLAHAEQQYKKRLCIDRLVLLGTPVQSETSDYVTADCFKKIYNVYSHGDTIQKLDIFSTRSRQSKRTFNHDNKKLLQINVSCGKSNPWHTELWLFGSKKNWLYRNSLPIAPFPVFVFLPIIMDVLDTHYSTTAHIKLNIDKDGKKLRCAFLDTKTDFTHCIDEDFLDSYRKKILQL